MDVAVDGAEDGVEDEAKLDKTIYSYKQRDCTYTVAHSSQIHFLVIT